MRLLYVLASYVLFALAFPLLALHKKTRHGFAERFGFYKPGKLPNGPGPTVWLHGASAGDLLSLSPMIAELRARLPGCKVVMSTVTNTGYLMATERLAKMIDAVVYAPWDLFFTTRRAMRALKPDLLVLEYTEIWPNLIFAAKDAGAKVVLTNGRFSPAHLGRYRTLFSAIGNPLRRLDLLLMREDDEAERVMRLGAPLERVWVTGNTKFDVLATQVAPDDEELRAAMKLPHGAPVLIAGSTHEGEEEKVLDVYKRLLADHPELRLVIAPRYIDRAPKVVALAQAAGLTVGLRSQGNPGGGRVVVLDTIGELSRAYRLGTLVFVGGSFTTRGGQNILEPAVQGRPVLFGPHMENFHDSVQVLVGRGGIQVNDPDHLFRIVSDLLARPDSAASLGSLARQAVLQVSGASKRNVDHMVRMLSATTVPRNTPPPPTREVGT